MSEWVKARGEAKHEVKEMEREIEGYGYKDREHAERTDRRFREIIAAETNKCRDFVFPMIEAAYLEKHVDNAGALEEVMQWLDVLLLELGLRLEWNEDADARAYVRLVKSDVTMLRNARRLADILEKMQEALGRGSGGQVAHRCAQLKKYVADILAVFKKRRHALGG